MSLYKYGDFEREVDFMDADFLDILHVAQQNMEMEVKAVPETGIVADIIRAQVSVYDHFFDTLFGAGSGKAIRRNKNSLTECVKASEALYELYQSDKDDMINTQLRYQVQKHGNRVHRNAYNKNRNRNYHGSQR